MYLKAKLLHFSEIKHPLRSYNIAILLLRNQGTQLSSSRLLSQSTEDTGTLQSGSR